MAISPQTSQPQKSQTSVLSQSGCVWVPSKWKLTGKRPVPRGSCEPPTAKTYKRIESVFAQVFRLGWVQGILLNSKDGVTDGFGNNRDFPPMSFRVSPVWSRHAALPPVCSSPNGSWDHISSTRSHECSNICLFVLLQPTNRSQLPTFGQLPPPLVEKVTQNSHYDTAGWYVLRLVCVQLPFFGSVWMRGGSILINNTCTRGEFYIKPVRRLTRATCCGFMCVWDGSSGLSDPDSSNEDMLGRIHKSFDQLGPSVEPIPFSQRVKFCDAKHLFQREASAPFRNQIIIRFCYWTVSGVIQRISFKVVGLLAQDLRT